MIIIRLINIFNPKELIRACQPMSSFLYTQIGACDQLFKQQRQFVSVVGRNANDADLAQRSQWTSGGHIASSSCSKLTRPILGRKLPLQQFTISLIMTWIQSTILLHTYIYIYSYASLNDGGTL